MNKPEPKSVQRAARALFKWDHDRRPDSDDVYKLIIYETMARKVLESAGNIKPRKKRRG